MAKTYPEDEFDQLARERSTEGAHRKPLKSNHWLIALVGVLVLAPLVGWGAIQLLGDGSPKAASVLGLDDEETTVAPTGDPSGSATPTDAASTSVAPTDDASATPSETPSVAAEPVLSTPIVVLNGRGTVGFAGENRDKLTADGFTSVLAADYTGGDTPVASTIYYKNADLKATADKVAEVLGVTELVESEGAVGEYEIAVVMR